MAKPTGVEAGIPYVYSDSSAITAWGGVGVGESSFPCLVSASWPVRC